MKKAVKVVGMILASLVLIVGVYAAYLILSYHRLEDHQTLAVEAPVSGEVSEQKILLEDAREFTIVTANLGFGAYDQEFDFFMDGGTKSWGKSKERVADNITGMLTGLKETQPDFLLLQEVDADGTRSYHIDQYQMVRNELPGYTTLFAQNYDSAFLFWPLYQPHGKNKAGIVTAANTGIRGGERRSLPISESLTKFLDLDRCYSISYIPVSDGRDLVLFNVHLSAYGADEEILKAQRDMLYQDMEREYQAGNFVIVGGDFNHDMAGDSDERYQNAVAEEASWAKRFDFDSIPAGFTLGSKKMVDEGVTDMAATCRDAGRAYDGTNDRWVLDAMIWSDNVEMLQYDTLDMDFQFSDHNPVYLNFRLNSENLTKDDESGER